MINTQKKTLLLLGMSIGVAVTAGVAAYFYIKGKQSSKRKEDPPSATQEKSKIDLRNDERISGKPEFEALVKSKFNFKIEEEGNLYTKEGILKVLQTFYDLKFQDFYLLSDKYRKVRRQYLDDMDNYTECGFQYFKALNTIFVESFDKLYGYGVLNPQKWAISFAASDIGDEEVNVLMFGAIEAWEKRLTGNKHISKATYFKIVDKQKQFLRKEIDEVEKQKKFIKMTGNSFEYLAIINSKSSDYIYQNFGVENEDVLAFSMENASDPDISGLEDSMEGMINELVEKLESVLSS